MKQLSKTQAHEISGGIRRVYFSKDGTMYWNEMPMVVPSSYPSLRDRIDEVIDIVLLNYAGFNNIPVTHLG